MISEALNKITGRFHHFKILVKYTPNINNGTENITTMRTLWMPCKREILMEREIKKLISPEFIKQIPKKYLKNGTIELREFYYLGYFRPIKKAS